MSEHLFVRCNGNMFYPIEKIDAIYQGEGGVEIYINEKCHVCEYGTLTKSICVLKVNVEDGQADFFGYEEKKDGESDENPKKETESIAPSAADALKALLDYAAATREGKDE